MKKKLLSVMLAVTLSVSCMTPLMALAKEGAQTETTENQDEQEDGVASEGNEVAAENGAANIVKSGSCGENATYTLDTDGVLTISGNGEIDDTFMSWNDVNSVNILPEITRIGAGAFDGCSNLSNISIPEGVTAIGNDAFRDCSSLTGISIPDGVTRIGGDAFSGCSSLSSITIPKSVTEIGTFAFENCTSLSNIEFNGSSLAINKTIFTNTAWLNQKQEAKELAILNNALVDGSCVSGNITIPEGTTRICTSAFYNNKNITGVTIPDSVTNIDEQAFLGCEGITTINVPATTLEIGLYALGYLSYDYDSNSECYVAKKIDGFILQGKSESETQNYAESNGITFEPVNSSEIENISIYTQPDKTVYGWYEELNPAGLSIQIHFTNGTSVIRKKGFQIGEVDNTSDGEKKVTITYKGYSTNMTVTFDKNIPALPESPHYEEVDKTWTIYKSGAKALAITFSEQTFGGTIYIEDNDENTVGIYNNIELSGKTIVVNGDTAKIRLSMSDYDDNVSYGFKVIKVTETDPQQEDSQLEYIYQKNEELETVYITCPEDGDYVLRFKNHNRNEDCKSLLLQMTIYDGTTSSDPVLQSRTIKPYRDTAETTLSSEYESALCIPLKGGKQYMATVQIKKNEEWSGINYNLEFVKKPTVTGIGINNDDCQLKAGESNPYGLNAWQFTVSYSDGSEQHLYRTSGEGSAETTDPYRLYDDYDNSYTFALKDNSQQKLFNATVGGDYPVQIKVSDGQTYEGTLNIKGSSKIGSVDGFNFEINDDGTVTVKNYTGTSEKVKIPKQLVGKQVTKISMFNSDILKEVTVPEGVQYVSINRAENVNISSTVSYIYIDQNSLNINVSEENPNFSSIDGVLFSKDKKNLLFLPEQRTGIYTVPDSVTKIKSTAIPLYSRIEKLVIGKNVTDINNENTAIAGINLKSIEVSKENKTFSSKDGVLFSKDGKKLLRFPCQKPGTTYNIPQGVTHIGNSAFFDAEVKEINFSNTVTTIEKEAFWQTMGISKIVIPANVTKIEACAFGGKCAVEDVTVLNPNCKIADEEWTLGNNLIRGFKGSTAEAYAKKYNQPFEVYTCDHSNIKKTIEKASMGKAGNVTKKCDLCGAVIGKETIPAPKTASLSKTSYTYNGKNRKPSVTVRDTKGNTLRKGTDYTVSYPKNCKKVGQYTVTIKFKGNYTGSTKKTYCIHPKGTSLSEVKVKSKSFTAKWKKQTSQTRGYQLQYATDKKFKKNVKNVTIKKNKTTSQTVKKLKAKKKYYVRIRTYQTIKVNGKEKKLYSDWSKIKNVTVRK